MTGIAKRLFMIGLLFVIVVSYANDNADNPVIIFQHSGGYAGVIEKWRIYPDGRIVDVTGATTRVSDVAVERLQSDIRDTGFFDFANSYHPKNPCCDRFSYVVRVRTNDILHSVSTIDATPHAPAELFDIIRKIKMLIASGLAND